MRFVGVHVYRRIGLIRLACAFSALGIAQAQTATETVIHAFGNFPQGANPYAPLFLGAQGALYGTTDEGGAANLGVVFKFDVAGYKALHSFMGGTDGASPYAGVTADSAGNLYGTTYQGGPANAGVVYKLDGSGKETVLYSFTGGVDGANPYAGVTLDSAGNLYGTTYQGGAANLGVVFKVDLSGQETVLHTFTGVLDGANPYGSVIADSQGNLYGTTFAGGSVFNAGVIYKLDAAGNETILYTFQGTTHPGGPRAGVVRDTAGNLYGTAMGGVGGTVYKLDTAGALTILHQFIGQGVMGPQSGVVRDAEGNLYGTTQHGGVAGEGVVYKVNAAGDYKVMYEFPGGPAYNRYANLPNAGVVLDAAGNVYGATPSSGLAGMVYKLEPTGQETTLYSFPAAAGGTFPFGSVIRDSAGNLYGTASNGGPANAGIVYKVDVSGREKVLYAFAGGADGANPASALVRDSAGNLYGTTLNGGTSGAGTVYKIDPSGQKTALYSFTGGADGATPNGVILDAAGNLYGTTFAGGSGSETDAQEGVVYKLDPAGIETVLHSFTGLSDGGAPKAGVIRDSAGNLYGTTTGGGQGAGVVYELNPSGRETVLYSFTGAADGGNPFAAVAIDASGNLYGTAANGGRPAGGGSGEGVLFELNTAGGYTVLYTFSGGAGGGLPLSAVVRDSAGNLYGTTSSGGGTACGGGGCGVVYWVAPSGRETVLHSFTGGADGGQPEVGVIFDPAGNLYGTCPYWGAAQGGVLYKLTPQ